jgi:teichuronic acid exporter
MAQNIKRQLVSGVLYTALEKYSGIVIQLVITAVLARLLPPADFGVVAVATVIIAFFALFTDMGISTAIVQNKTLTDDDLSNIFSFTLWSGLALALLFFASSWLIGGYYDNSTLTIICQLLSLNLFTSSITIVPNALFYKNKDFKYIALRGLTVQTACGIIGVGAALLGAGLYALVIPPILSGILLFVISVRRYPQKAQLTWGLVSIRKIFSYSAYQFLFNVINYFSRNLDKLVIGKKLGMKPLGYYQKSYSLMMLPLQNITAVVTPVIHPIFSDFQNDLEKLATGYERIVRFLSFVGFPLTVGLYFTARELTLIIFGPQWLPSIPVFKILAVSAGVQVVMSSSGSIFQASGDTKSLFVCGVFSAVLNVTGILFGVFYFGTLEGVAYCISTTFAINFVQCYWQMYHVTFHRSARTFVRQLLSPLLISALLVAVLLPIDLFTKNMNIVLSVLLKGAIFAIVYGTYIQLTGEYDLIGKAKTIINRNNNARA